MSIISGVTVNWKLSPRIITIPNSVTEVTIEDLQDTLLDIEDSEEGIVFPKLRDCSGGEALGGNLFIGYTLKLNNAKIKFADRAPPTITCEIKSGNILAIDVNGSPMTPIEASNNVTVVKTSAVSAAIVGNDKDAIIDGVWDELTVGHSPANSFGELINRVKGLSQENYRIFNPTYDANKNLTSATIKIYDSAGDCNNDYNPLATYTVTATYDSNGNMSTYKVTKN